MFEKLTQRFENTWARFAGRQLNEKNISDILEEVRTALLEADVALKVIDQILVDVRKKALGQIAPSALTPAHLLLKIIFDEFVEILGKTNEKLKFPQQPPGIMMVAGLQGSGKTTSVAKLANYLVQKEKKAVLVASVDIYRPGAIEQLKIAVAPTGARFFESDASQSPEIIAENAIKFARSHYIDVVIIDTAGRLHIDDAMMDEIKKLYQQIQPDEMLYVLDSMMGQDAARSAEMFNQALPLTGLILTKMDGDARAGAVLSVRYLTQKPIKFMGVGEKIDALELFHPERIASRILGQGDLLTLAEEAQQHIEVQDAQKMAQKIKKGHLDLTDFQKQIKQLVKMGGVANLLSKLPGMSQMGQMLGEKGQDRSLLRISAMIDSMTPKERSQLNLTIPPQNMRLPIHMKRAKSRIERIARGSGTDAIEVKRMLNQFKKMQEVMKKVQKGGGNMENLMAQFGQNSPFP